MKQKEKIKKILSNYLSHIPMREDIAENLIEDLDQLLQAEREECAKEMLSELNDNQKKIYQAFTQCFMDESFHIDKFLLWVVKEMNVEQSIFLREHNQVSN